MCADRQRCPLTRGNGSRCIIMLQCISMTALRPEQHPLGANNRSESSQQKRLNINTKLLPLVRRSVNRMTDPGIRPREVTQQRASQGRRSWKLQVVLSPGQRYIQHNEPQQLNRNVSLRRRRPEPADPTLFRRTAAPEITHIFTL